MQFSPYQYPLKGRFDHLMYVYKKFLVYFAFNLRWLSAVSCIATLMDRYYHSLWSEPATIMISNQYTDSAWWTGCRHNLFKKTLSYKRSWHKNNFQYHILQLDYNFCKVKKKTLLCIRGHPQFLKIYAGSETCEVSRNLEPRQGIYKDALVIMTPIWSHHVHWSTSICSTSSP